MLKAGVGPKENAGVEAGADGIAPELAPKAEVLAKPGGPALLAGWEGPKARVGALLETSTGAGAAALSELKGSALGDATGC